jgi:hypothetical protein
MNAAWAHRCYTLLVFPSEGHELEERDGLDDTLQAGLCDVTAVCVGQGQIAEPSPAVEVEAA